MAEVKINNVSYDAKNTALNIVMKGITKDGQPVAAKKLQIVKGWEELEYTTTINREKFYGADRLPASRTEGQAEFAASITLNRDTANYLIKTAQSMSIPLAFVEMSVGVTYSKAGIDPVTDTLAGIALQEIGATLSNGDAAPTLITLPLDPMNIFYSGVDVYGNSLS